MVRAMKHPDYPGVSSMVTRHGKTRWRLRRSGKPDVMLPGEPHTADFDKAYQDAVLGIKALVFRCLAAPALRVSRLPTAS